MSNQTLDVTSFDAHFVGVVLPIGLRLDTIDLQGTGLHLESKPFAASVQKPGEMTITVLQESLASYLDRQSPAGLRDFDVSIHDGKLVIQATKNMLFDVRATAVCKLRIVDSTKLYVDITSVEALGGSSLTNMVRAQMESINPIFETDDLPVKAKLTSVEADAGRVVLKGMIEP